MGSSNRLIKPIHPLERREFDGFEMPPRSLPANHLGLEQPDDEFGERIVVGIAATPDRRRDARVGG
jgi:hypothetical protein